MVKKLISSALAVSLVLGGGAMLPEWVMINSSITTRAIDINTGKCGDNITWAYDGKGTLTLSGTGNMYDHLSYGDGDFAYFYEGIEDENQINSVIIEDGITNIGKYAFSGFHDLTNVFIADSVRSIDNCAFRDCENLKSISIPYGVMSIGSSAFSGCIKLKNITIPSTVKCIGSNAFSETEWLKRKQNKNPLVIVNGILIDADKCTGKVTIPEGVTSIADCAFTNNSNITGITLPKSIQSISRYSFENTKWLKTKIKKDPLVIVDGVLLSGANCGKKVKIPDGVRIIADGAFENCGQLESIEFPKSVERIGYRAFYSTNWLSKQISDNQFVIVNDNLIAINNDYRKGELIIPKGIKHISCDYGTIDYDDEDGTVEDSIVIPKSVESISHQTVGYYFYGGSEVSGLIHKKDYVIYCVSGSAAEQYAIENGFEHSAQNVALASITVKNKTYTGKAIKPAPTVKVGKTKLTKGIDYTVTYKKNKAVGKATVTIKGKGAYTGTVSKTFKINPKKTSVKKATSPKTGQLKITYKKVKGVTGYQVTYSTSKKFTKSTTKTATLNGVSKLSKTIKKLKSGKKYYLKVRAYKTVSGKKYYSKYTAVKSVKVK
ncbi:MAG: leucine-rich repeat protein [Ruminococcus sp.]|nr:leucine-rich repeat protein [Ruminococcus sp.]